MKKVASFLAVLAVVAVAPAWANLDLSLNGVDCNSMAFGTPPIAPGVTLECVGTVVPVPGVDVTNYSTTGVQSPSGSEQLTSAVSVINTTGSAVTLTLGAGISNFTFPLAPPSIRDASSITLDETLVAGPSPTATGTLTSCVDQSNGLVPPDSAFCTSPAPGSAPANPAVTVTGAQTNGNTTIGAITALTAPFSLTQELTLTLGAGTSLNFTLTQSLTPVPEPAGIVLLGSVLLGVGLRFRKRAARQS